jgi:outer membrane protein
MRCSLICVVLMAGGMLMSAPDGHAQQRIAYIESDAILQRIPEYATVQQNIDRMVEEWRAELAGKQREIDELFREYQARELLYTEEERVRKRDEIVQREEEAEQLRVRYFGPEGELFRQQEQLMRPIQERILEAVEEIAASEGYDFVFDKSGDYLFLYSREQHNLSDRVLEALGVDAETAAAGRSR